VIPFDIADTAKLDALVSEASVRSPPPSSVLSRRTHPRSS